MKARIIAVLMLGAGYMSFAQTIINAERYMDDIDSTIAAITLSYNGTQGNSTTNQLDISPVLLIKREKNEFKLLGGYNILTESGVSLLKSAYIHLRHNFSISSSLSTFEFYQRQFSNVLLIDMREIYGGGLKFHYLEKTALTLKFSLGVMREHEVLSREQLLPDEIFETKYFRATFIHSAKVKIRDQVTIDNVTYYQPYLGDFNDYRILNDLVVAVSLSKGIFMQVSLSTRFDSQPPGTLTKTDNVISVGVTVKH